MVSLESTTHKSAGGYIERFSGGELRTGCFLTRKVLFCPLGLVYKEISTAKGYIAKGTFAIFNNVAESLSHMH